MVKSKRLASTLLAAFLSLLLVNDVRAETILITGNGDGSSSEVSTTVTQEVVVEQQNNSQVSNDVDVNANTGDNNVSENTGGENVIETGSVDSSVSVSNDNINSNTAVGGCCNQGDTNIEISGNGSQSTNSVSSQGTTTTVVSQTNNAKIVNSVTTSANTGNNTANSNVGDVSIKTGDISSSTQVINKGINFSYNKVNTGNTHLSIKIKDNAPSSLNKIEFVSLNDTLILVENVAKIKNEVADFLTTGNNTANGNTGGVYISTGGIVSNVYIENSDINSSVSLVSKDVCAPDKDKDGNDDKPKPPTPPTPPPPPTDGNGGNGGGNGGNGGDGGGNGGVSAGHVLAVAAGQVLPVTGINWYLFALIVNIFMFLMGLYLRLHSGRSPAVVLAE